MLSPGEEGSNGAVRLAQRLAAQADEVAFLYQYGNPANPGAHYEGTCFVFDDRRTVDHDLAAPR